MKKFALFLTIFFASTVSNLNIPAIEHSHSNLQNTDPILPTLIHMTNLPVFKE